MATFVKTGNPYANKEPRLEIYQEESTSALKRYRWRIWMSSDKVAASTESYNARKDAIENLLNIEQHIKWLRENGKIV